MVKLIYIKKSTRKGKKMMAKFEYKNGNHRTIHFGSSDYSDLTIHKDNERKKRYIARHKKKENWNKADNAGSLSRWILWNKKTLRASISDYKKRFNL